MSIITASARKRAAAHIAAMGPAIEGQHGDNHTYRVATVLIIDYALPFDIALEEMRAWNATCQPPWPERDLIKKLQNAQRYGRHTPGAKLNEAAPLRRTFDSADEVIDILLSVLCEPLDPERTVRDLAELGIVAEPDPAGDLRERQRLIGWLLAEADGLLPWKRKPRKNAPKYGKVKPEHRPAALLAALGAFLDAEELPAPAERLTWIMEQTAREHFACHPAKGACHAEILSSHKSLDAKLTPDASDGNRRAQPLPTHGERVPARRYVVPGVQFPDDPEVLYGRKEAFVQFASSLKGNERAIFDVPPSESPATVAQRVGTDANTVKTTRYRIRKKAKEYGEAANEPDPILSAQKIVGVAA